MLGLDFPTDALECMNGITLTLCMNETVLYNIVKITEFLRADGILSFYLIKFIDYRAYLFRDAPNPEFKEKYTSTFSLNVCIIY